MAGTRHGGRPLTRLTVVSLAAHVAIELGAGVGMPLASVLGPATPGFWLLVGGGAWRIAGADHRYADAVSAAVNGFGLAAVAAHLGGWPTRRTRIGLPWLEECEGLGAEMMPAYNTILYLSGVAALLAVVREKRGAPAHLPVAMLALAPALVAFQHWEHRRLRNRAHTRPGWWTRRLRRLAPMP
ncbi:hypothetical protein [Rugosimonospora africana]|uniref:Uncharacterized protein n=1 Tax=Rugosimonospora africana TaxID=556532 RepID=A0A8J3QU47_9ACTN|nr:hypothetical protein [Rugosimonospora africana]GIH15830.1 hypothetical protein Raf01_40020 [Rugosimonospora africana]